MQKSDPKAISIIICIAVVISFSACHPSAPETAAQELCIHTWVSEDHKGTLTFHDNIISISIPCNQGKTKLTGNYFANEEIITVVTKDYGNIELNYKLDNEKLLLSYAGTEMTFFKTT